MMHTLYLFLQDFVIVLEPYVQLEDDFVECFLTSPRQNSYTALFNSSKDDWFKPLLPEGNLLAILEEVNNALPVLSLA